MSTFEAPVVPVRIREHPNADAIELALVGDYVSIVQKGQLKDGDLVVYIPEAAIVPQWLLSKLGLEGKLAGKAQNRVKAIRLRGVLSQGLVYPLIADNNLLYEKDGDVLSDVVMIGDDVAELLGITKWEPPIPTHMEGEVESLFGKTISYDFENIKMYPHVLAEDEDVYITEKIHGTWCCFGWHPDVDHPVVSSKGMSSKGLAFKFNEANVNNLYVRAFNQNNTILDKAKKAVEMLGYPEGTPVYVLGEVFGAGVQDLKYGMNAPEFRAFDVYVGHPHQGEYLGYDKLVEFCSFVDIPMVPVLYVGKYSKDIVAEYTNGMETVSGVSANIREGVVVTPVAERYELTLGRVKLKSVSEDYLLRKGGTELN